MIEVPDLDENEQILIEYEGDIRVVKVPREGDPPRYRFDAPLMKPRSSDNSLTWENPHEATMYAAVFAAVGTFREEKTGKRGIPIEVERDGREAVIAYVGTQPGMTTDWIEATYELERERIYEYRSRIKSRAGEILVEDNTEELL